MIFDKTSPERSSEGNYRINDESWQTLWIYKRFRQMRCNTTSTNRREGLELSATYDYYKCKGETVDTVFHMYRVTDLNRYYGISL